MNGPPPTVPDSIWTFTVVAAIVTTSGTLLGHLLKEVLLARSFESWKRRHAIADVHRKFRDPIVLAALELASRLIEVMKHYPSDYLHAAALSGVPQGPNQRSTRDQYFQRYKCQSTMYRLAALLGWIELYRQELVFMDAERSKSSELIYPRINRIRADLADGHLNKAPDWEDWADALIFREEQRAVGETMIVASAAGRSVLGYAAFVGALEDANHSANRWLRCLVNFFTDPRREKDFRRRRFLLLIVHLVELVEVVDAKRLTPALRRRAARYRAIYRGESRRARAA